MANAWRQLTESELETALRDVGPHLDYPPSEHVAFAVRQRLEQTPAGRRRLVGRPATRAGGILRPLFVPAWQRVAVALIVLVAIVSGVLTFSPAARKAVAGWLGLRGVRIKVTPEPSLSPVPLGGNLVLGVPVSLAEAQASVPFKILVPSASGFATPDEIDLIPSFAETGQVSLLYRARPGLPTATETRLGLILTEFQARVDERFLVKVVPEGTSIQAVTVNGEPGFLLEGAPHEVYYTLPDGQPIRDTVRLAGNTLLWQHGQVTLRLEAHVTKEQALAIAESVG